MALTSTIVAVPVLLAWTLCALPGAVSFRHKTQQIEGERAHLNVSKALLKPKVKVEVLFIRHGHACHNLMNAKYQGSTTFAKVIHCRYRDPPLTDCGLRSSEENGRELRQKLDGVWGWKPHFLGASSMIRAMETASAMFPGITVHSLPFISEMGGGVLSPCNEPAPIAQQRRALGNNNTFKFDLVSWDNYILLQDERVKRYANRVNSRGHKVRWTSEEARSKVHYRVFRSFLGEQVVKKLVESQEQGYEMKRNTKIVRIAIVTHSMFLRGKIKKYFKCDSFFEKVYFKNNAAMIVYYDYDPETQMLKEGTSMTGLTCQLPLQGRSPRCGWNKKYACAGDYQRCYAHEGWKYMGFSAEPVKNAPSPYVSPEPAQESTATCCVSQECPASDDNI